MSKNKDELTADRARSASAYESLVGFARAVRRGSRIVVSGTAPLGPDGETVVGDAYDQAKRCYEIILEAIEALGGTLEDVVRTRMYVIDAADWESIGRAHGEFFRDVYPASTLIVVKGLLDPRWKVEIEAEAELLPK
ncbi:MAG: RidA family protein [Thermoanaerobaculales bacterium]|nr:RidA family protein [Thermoanaerobaculales bacterium]